MESISGREEVLLGYKSYNTITVSKSESRKSDDVDFSDVFGGPPRRSSTQSGDSYSNGDNNDGEDEGSSSSSWWMKLREKPVFGEATTGVRRRYTSDDFFDDIFRGDQPSSSCSQSPRVSYLSAPASRLMSPSRSLPPAPLFGTPSKFSLPTRATNPEFTASTSMNQSSFNPHPPMSRFNQTTQNQRHNSSESTSGSQLDGSLDQFSPHSNAKGSDFPIYATNFHFSIYKWASKSVPLVVSLRKKSAFSKATKLEQFPSESEKGIDADILLSEKHNVFVSNTVRPSSPVKEYEHRHNSLKSPITTEAKSKENVTAPAESNPTFVVSPSDAVDTARQERARESRNLMSKGSDSKVYKSNDPSELPTQRNSNLRPLGSFLNDSTGNEQINTKNTGDKMSRVEEKEKASTVDGVSSHEKVNKNAVRNSSQARRKDVSNNNEALGKVKDFVKIFNQESPSKASSHGLHKSRSKKWKDSKTIETDQEKLSSTKIEETEATYVNWGEELTDTVEMEDVFSSESRQFTVNDIGSEPQNVEQPSVNASKADSLKDSASINNAPSDDDVLSNEAIKGYETKVLQWSKGKEGNIRSLLSTLQYVLWPESGWKPVPLVEIIEANAVKRAYQKALLRLHPDKLQQKGAAQHHKLIAEKVFDILQEAWDQFNSLGSL